jgi:sugar phosphate isomerase/epimerase
LPIGQGAYDHRRVLELLQAEGYDGYLSGEWINWEPYEVHLPRELATLKQYEAEIP